MLLVYGCPKTRSVRVTWALEEIGAPYEYHKVDLMKGEGRRPPFVDINPSGKVPALVDDDLVLTESAAIVTYLGDKFPDSGLTPSAGTKHRGEYERWCIYAVAELEQPLWTIAKHSFALPEKYRVPAIKDTAGWEFTRCLPVVAQALEERPYMLGDDFSAVDILIAHSLNWGRSTLGSLDNELLDAYVDRTMSRPALERARAREAAADPAESEHG